MPVELMPEEIVTGLTTVVVAPTGLPLAELVPVEDAAVLLPELVTTGA